MKKNNNPFMLFIGALGIVYGDIGTSPLYALKSCFSISKLAVNPFNVTGIISLFIWTIILITSVKYVAIVMRADDQGEGGILILTSLCNQLVNKAHRWIIITIGIVGTTLFFGDGIITPAISVLSALEGLTLIDPIFQKNTVYLGIVVLILLFMIQKNGSSQIGKYYGPLIMIWFVIISIMGANQIFRHPEILYALNPLKAVHFLIENKVMGFLTLGGVILVVTGAEALYADMGHFGKQPIKWTWYTVVFPALILNYLGQGALLIANPLAVESPFYMLAPQQTVLSLTIFSTIITVIAAQAVISGVFSLCWQAINLGYIPRLKVVHTSNQFIGQVYIPVINIILCFFTIIAVLIFRTSDNLAVAYGLNVSCLMMLTSILTIIFCYYKLQWSKLKIVMIVVPILLIEIVFTGTNLVKIFHGAWFTLTITIMVSYIIYVWRTGNSMLTVFHSHQKRTLNLYLRNHLKEYSQRIPGTAIFLTKFSDIIPASLITHLKYNKFLHQKLLIVSIVIENKAFIRNKSHFKVIKINSSCYKIIASYGFKETPNLNKLVSWVAEQGIIDFDDKPSLYVSKGIPVSNYGSGLQEINNRLYILMARNSLTTYEYFRIPLNHMLEMGIRYEI